MNSTPEQPLTRRAAREARSGTGEQPSVDAATAGIEDTASTGGQVVLDADGQPLTRRRLREMRETGLIPIVTPSAAPVAEGEPEVAPEPEAGASVAPGPHYFRPSASIPRETAPQPEARPAEASQSETPQPTAPQPEVPQSETAQSAFAPVPAVAGAPVPTWTAPEGHWTRQLEQEDDLEVTASREVGGASTSSVLVVSEVPKVVDLGGPLGETGQMLLTGSVTLSPDFAATGAIKRLDSDADLSDGFDGPHPVTGDSAAPLRASAIASQHALGTPIVAGSKPRASRAINVLIVTAAVLAVLVTGLVVTAVVLRWI